jgi:hypothetical protein
MNLLSILYFLSYQPDIAKELRTRHELMSFLDRLGSCPVCPTHLIQPHVQLAHYACLLRSNLQNSAPTMVVRPSTSIAGYSFNHT